MTQHLIRSLAAGCAAAMVLLTALRPGANAQAPQPSATTPAQGVVIRGGWLFDGISDARVRNTGIVVRNGKFLEVGADLAGRNLAGAQVIELDDNVTILPGFFDLHAHYNMNLVGEGRVEEADTQAMIHLANGVTSTWSAGEFFPEKMFATRDRIESGKQPGTRIFPSGPYFGAFRCEYKIQKAEDDCPAWPNTITEKQIRDDLDYWASKGVRSIKIKQSTPAEMRILIDQAHKHGMTTTSHLANYAGGWDVHTKEAILMGLDRVEHWVTEQPRRGGTVGTPGDPDNADLNKMIALFIKHRVYFDGNMQMFGGNDLRQLPEMRPKMLWVDEAKFFTPYARTLIEARQAQRANAANTANTANNNPANRLQGFKVRTSELKAFYDQGGAHLMVLGTDNPTSGPLLPGFSYHREMQAWAYSGIPPVGILKAATINGARSLKLGDQLGSIEPGKIADLVIVTGNPLQDITATREVRTVMKAGQVYDPKALLDAAVNKIGPTSKTDHPAWTMYDKVLPVGTYR